MAGGEGSGGGVQGLVGTRYVFSVKVCPTLGPKERHSGAFHWVQACAGKHQHRQAGSVSASAPVGLLGHCRQWVRPNGLVDLISLLCAEQQQQDETQKRAIGSAASRSMKPYNRRQAGQTQTWFLPSESRQIARCRLASPPTRLRTGTSSAAAANLHPRQNTQSRLCTSSSRGSSPGLMRWLLKQGKWGMDTVPAVHTSAPCLAPHASLSHPSLIHPSYFTQPHSSLLATLAPE